MFQGAEAEPAKPSSRWGSVGRSVGRGEESCGGAESSAGLCSAAGGAGRAALAERGEPGVWTLAGEMVPPQGPARRGGEAQPRTSRTAGERPRASGELSRRPRPGGE